MELPEEIKNAAQALGISLHENDFIRAYLNAVEEFQADPEARRLEEQLYATYNALIARQGAGEQLSHEETQAFFELRHRMQSNPIIAQRDSELRLIKPHLAEIADEIGASLGVDYTTLARSE